MRIVNCTKCGRPACAVAPKELSSKEKFGFGKFLGGMGLGVTLDQVLSALQDTDAVADLVGVVCIECSTNG